MTTPPRRSPLGPDADVPVDHSTRLLTCLVGPRAAPALVPPGRLTGLARRATDTSWSAGAGAAVEGRWRRSR